MYNYKELGKYSIIVKEYLKYYPKEQILFLIFEEFVKNPHKELEKVTDFLGLKKFYNYQYRHELGAKRPRSLGYQRFIRNIVYGSLNGHGGFIWPGRFKKPVFDLLTRFNQSSSQSPKIKDSTREDLKSFFKPYNKELSRLLDKDLSVWDD